MKQPTEEEIRAGYHIAPDFKGSEFQAFKGGVDFAFYIQPPQQEQAMSAGVWMKPEIKPSKPGRYYAIAKTGNGTNRRTVYFNGSDFEYMRWEDDIEYWLDESTPTQAWATDEDMKVALKSGFFYVKVNPDARLDLDQWLKDYKASKLKTSQFTSKQ